MAQTMLRRTGALIAAAAMLASLNVATVAAPAAAQGPTCDDRAATITDNDGNDANPDVGVIVGTNGPDVIVGTDGDDFLSSLGGRDRICGGLGDDDLFGGNGNDRLFGGSGDDDMEGGRGSDDLFGFGGNDTLNGASLLEDTEGPSNRDFLKGGGGKDNIFGGPGADILQGNGGSDFLRGQAGNDSLNGGPAVDDCTQGAGSGPVRRCERADLKVVVLCPSNAPEGNLTCRVRVINLGPDATPYNLSAADSEGKGGNTVSCSNDWELEQDFGSLGPGQRRTIALTGDCEIVGQPPVIWFRAEVDPVARDPRPGNNQDDDSTALN